MTKEQIAAMNNRVKELQAKDASSLTQEEVTFLTDSTRIANSLAAQQNAKTIEVEDELLAGTDNNRVEFSTSKLREYWKKGNGKVQLPDDVRVNNALTAGADFVLLSKYSDTSLRKPVLASAGLVDFFEPQVIVKDGQTIAQIMGDDNITITYGNETGSVESNVWTGSVTVTAKEISAKGSMTDKLVYGSDSEFGADFQSQYTNAMRRARNVLYWSGAGDVNKMRGIAAGVAADGAVASSSIALHSASYASGELRISGSVGQINTALATAVRTLGDYASGAYVFVTDAAHALLTAEVDTLGNQTSLSREYAGGKGTLLGLPVVRANVSGATVGSYIFALVNPSFYKTAAFTPGILFKSIETNAGVDRVFKFWQDAELAKKAAAYLVYTRLG